MHSKLLSKLNNVSVAGQREQNYIKIHFFVQKWHRNLSADNKNGPSYTNCHIINRCTSQQTTWCATRKRLISYPCVICFLRLYLTKSQLLACVCIACRRAWLKSIFTVVESFWRLSCSNFKCLLSIIVLGASVTWFSSWKRSFTVIACFSQITEVPVLLLNALDDPIVPEMLLESAKDYASETRTMFHAPFTLCENV